MRRGSFVETIGNGCRQMVGWSFFNHFLEAALDRTLALEQVHQTANAVTHELHFKVARIDDVFFEQDAFVAERSQRLPAGQCQHGQEICRRIDAPHALATATGAGLDEEWKPDALRFTLQPLRRLVVLVVTGNAQHTSGACHALALDLGPHGFDGAPVGADKGDGVCMAGIDQFQLFRKKTITGMNGLRAAGKRGRNDAVSAQIGVAGTGLANGDSVVGLCHVAAGSICGGIHGNSLDAQASATAHDSAGDLATVGDQQSVEHGITS